MKLRPTEVENTRSLLGENLSGNRDLADPSQKVSEGNAKPSTAGELALSVPRLELENIPVPTGSSQVELDREGIIRLKEGSAPWEEGSNTTVVGHRLGFLFTKLPYIFYELDKMERGDEVTSSRRSAGRARAAAARAGAAPAPPPRVAFFPRSNPFSSISQPANPQVTDFILDRWLMLYPRASSSLRYVFSAVWFAEENGPSPPCPRSTVPLVQTCPLQQSDKSYKVRESEKAYDLEARWKTCGTIW